MRLDLLAHLAEEKGFHQGPEFVRCLKQELASLYLEKEFEEPQRRRAPTDEEVRQAFEARKEKLHRPERLRLALIAFRAEDDAARERKRALAQSAFTEVQRRRDYGVPRPEVDTLGLGKPPADRAEGWT